MILWTQGCEFESRHQKIWSLFTFTRCVIELLFEKTEIKQKRGRDGPFSQPENK